MASQFPQKSLQNMSHCQVQINRKRRCSQFHFRLENIDSSFLLLIESGSNSAGLESKIPVKLIGRDYFAQVKIRVS